MWKYSNTDELYHWGILGMKWGIRRYQNKDGTLTPEGKRRQKSYDHIESRRIKKKRLSQMSNNELRKLNERQRLEEQYKQQNSAIKKGKNAVLAAGAIIGAMVTVKKNAPGLYKSGKNLVEKARYQKWLFMHR